MARQVFIYAYYILLYTPVQRARQDFGFGGDILGGPAHRGSWGGPRENFGICKKYLKKTAKYSIFAGFQQNFENSALIFLAFGRKLTIEF